LKLTILQNGLAKALKNVSRFTTSKSSLAVLNNVLLRTADGSLEVGATNLETGVIERVGARVEEDGAITVPARLLTDYVNALPDEQIELWIDETTQTLYLRCGKDKTTIKGISWEEFPILNSAVPNVDGWETIELPAQQLNRLIETVAFSAATDESRPILTAVLFDVALRHLTLAAADGYRLASDTVLLAEQFDGIGFSANVPAKPLGSFDTLFPDGVIRLSVNSRQAIFEGDNITVTTQLQSGKFPDYQQIIPTYKDVEPVIVTFNRVDLLKAAQRAKLFAADSANIVVFSPYDKKLTLSSSSAELGDNKTEIAADVEGLKTYRKDDEDILVSSTIAFNIKYVINILDAHDCEQMKLTITVESAPGVFSTVGNDDFVGVIMPMRINR